MNGWEIYLLTRLDGIQSCCVAAASISGVTLLVAGLVLTVFRSECSADVDRAARKWCPRLVWIFLLAFLLAGLIPRTNEAVAIWVLPKIVNSEFASETVPADMRDLYKTAIAALKAKLEAPR
jgi:hypothetical protein